MSELPVPAQSILDALPVSIAVTGPIEDDSPIVYANSAFLQLTGYSLEEVKGKNPRILQPNPLPKSQLNARRQLAKIVTSQNGGAGWILNKRKDDSVYWAAISLAPLLNESNQCAGYVAAQMDVTKQVDQTLELKRERQAVVDESIKVLFQILWIHARGAAKRCERLCRLACAAAPCWPQIDAKSLKRAASLTYIGFILDQDDILHKSNRCEPLNKHQKEVLLTYPQRGADLIGNLPNMDEVANAIRWFRTDYAPLEQSDDIPSGDKIPLIARILRVLDDLDRHTRHFKSPAEAINHFAENKESYDPCVVRKIKRFLPNLIKNGWPERWETDLMPINRLMTGMIFDQDLYDNCDRLLISKGQQINEPILSRLRDMKQREIIQDSIAVAYLCA